MNIYKYDTAMLAPIGALRVIFLLFHSAHPHSVINKTLLTVLLSRFKTTETNSQIVTQLEAYPPLSPLYSLML